MEQETKNFGPKTPEKIMELKKLGKLRKFSQLTKEEVNSMKPKEEPTKEPCCSDDCKYKFYTIICIIMVIIVVCASLVFLGYYLGGGLNKK